MTTMKLHNLIKAAGLGLLLFTLNSVKAQDTIPQKNTPAPVKKTVRLPLTGVITDAATGKGLVGISITVKNFSAAITDDKGEFKLSVPSYSSDVIITGEGYESRQVSLKGSKTLRVALLDDSHTSFQQPVTMPLFVTTKRNLTASAGIYNTNGEWKRPDETIDALLQGQVSGLNSIKRSGTSGVGANLFVRGYNSLYGTNSPLIVVDGMLYDANDYGKSIIENNATNPLSLISVQDIDNVTVLKDASSIYGTKGANGAIIITTNRAKKEATTIDFGVFTSMNMAPDLLPVMDASSYRIYLSEILQSKGMSAAEIAALPYMNDDTSGNNQYYRYHNNTNWQNKVLRNSLNKNIYLKVTGGDNIATYALSMGYMKNDGVIKNTDLTRYNTRFNAEFNFSKRFKGTTNLSFTYNEQNLKNQGNADKTAPIFLALTKSPFLTSQEVNEKGIFSPNLEETDILGKSNPTAIIENMLASNKYYRLFGSFKFNYDITKTLNASTMFGVVYDKVRENIFIPRKGVADDTLSNAIADSRLGSQVKRLFTVYSDSRLEYKKTIARNHNLSSRLGFRIQKNKAEQDYTLGYNSATDELISVQNGVTALRQVGGGVQEWNWMNTYFNADYDYKEKLFVSFNAAMDGSSRFGSLAKNGVAINGNKFAIMPSVGVAWLLSSENFMTDSRINLFKLRFNYSISGNDDIGNYNHIQTYGSQNLLGMQGLVRNGIPNPAIQWETSKKANLGFDMALWNERLGISLDLYKTVTRNMLAYENLPAASGFEKVLTNSGSMQNKGFEATVSFRTINKANLKWDVGVTFATNENKVISIPGNSMITQYAGASVLTQNGSEAGLFYGYIAKGVLSSAAEAGAYGLKKKNADGSYSTFSAGDVRFLDLNGDHVIDENDRQIIGIPTPKFFGSISSRLMYKRFQLDALFTFSQGNQVFNYLRYRLESASGVENQLNSVVNRWRADGQVTAMPKATYGDPMGNNRFSTRWIEDGSYLRLRNVSLSYSIPFKGVAVKNATIYVTGNNLLTFTKYMGYDPEFSAGPGVFTQGIDTGLDPVFKSVSLGARIGL